MNYSQGGSGRCHAPFKINRYNSHNNSLIVLKISQYVTVGLGRGAAHTRQYLTITLHLLYILKYIKMDVCMYLCYVWTRKRLDRY